MTEEINKYIELKISNSLLTRAPEKFADKLMREIELSKEFDRQDKRVYLSVRYVISGLIIIILSFVFAVSYYLTSQADNDNSAVSTEYYKIGNYLNDFFSGVFSFFGINFTNDFFLYAFAVLILFGIIAFTDRKIFKRSY